jgi:thiol-disulfide isomerase/thioredoxin
MAASARKTYARKLFPGFILLAVAALPASLAQNADPTPASPDGNWSGVSQFNGQQVPIRIEIHGKGEHLQGALVNGTGRSLASSGAYSGGHVILHFDYYANTLDATLKDGLLTGTFSNASRSIPFTARRDALPAPPSPDPPRIAGSWEVAVKSSKGESAWELRVNQSGATVDAVIQRIDGDTGNLYGTWRNGQFAVSHFTAAGPSITLLRPQTDGTLQVVTFAHGGETQVWSARRPEAARTEGLNGPDDPLQHTKLRDPNRPLSFSAKDLNGKLVSSKDPQFKGKVVIVSVGGSWCPNCHDEAPFLEDLYSKYHSSGLQVVELSFEEGDQVTNPNRLKAMMRKYGITYPVLIAGTPDQLNQALPQAVGLDCWPTTFFIGRDGLVKTIHAGFSGPATQIANTDLRKSITSMVLKLLSANQQASTDSRTSAAAH